VRESRRIFGFAELRNRRLRPRGQRKRRAKSRDEHGGEGRPNPAKRQESHF
jgi:hypothetical protein